MYDILHLQVYKQVNISDFTVFKRMFLPFLFPFLFPFPPFPPTHLLVSD